MSVRIPIENLDYPAYNLVIVLVSGAILAAGYLFLKYTRYGIWLRAVAENRPMAGSLGVPVPRVYFLAFVLSAGLAGVAGALLAPVVSVYTTVGADVIINAFIVVVAGGMGNFRGAALVALLLGEVEAVGSNGHTKRAGKENGSTPVGAVYSEAATSAGILGARAMCGSRSTLPVPID